MMVIVQATLLQVLKDLMIPSLATLMDVVPQPFCSQRDTVLMIASDHTGLGFTYAQATVHLAKDDYPSGCRVDEKFGVLLVVDKLLCMNLWNMSYA